MVPSPVVKKVTDTFLASLLPGMLPGGNTMYDVSGSLLSSDETDVSPIKRSHITIPRANCRGSVMVGKDWGSKAGQMIVVALIFSGMPSNVATNRAIGDGSLVIEREVRDLPRMYIPPCTAQALHDDELWCGFA